MEFLDSRVQEIFENLKIILDSSKSVDLKPLIKNFSLSQKFELFCHTKNLGVTYSDIFTQETAIWGRFDDLFKNNYSESALLLEDPETSLVLVEVALLTGLLDLEDYRTIIRFLYTNSTDIDEIVLKINLSILRYLYKQEVGSQILSELSSMLRYLGIPLAYASDLKNDFLKYFPEAQAQIEEFLELPITTCQRYPDYLSELAEQIDYDKDIPVLRNWLNHETLNMLERSKINHFIKSYKFQKIKTSSEIAKKLKAELVKKNMSSIPFVFDTFIKPFSAHLQPQNIKADDINPNIPAKILQSYVEKLAYPFIVHKDRKIRVIFLGGSEIGSMGILICTPYSNVLIDFGMSVANYQIPFWDAALNHLDAIFITHAHLDHSGGIPYLFAQGYKGFVFGSSTTKNLMNFLLHDNIELMAKNIDSSVMKADFRFRYLAQSQYVHQTLDHYVSIESGKEYCISPDIVVKSIPTNHIQGSFAYLIECEDKQILFSGDANFNPTELFNNKPVAFPSDTDLTIVDSTYYGQPNFNFQERDKELFQTVKEDRKVIIPAFSVGRAQEIMLKLEKSGLTKERKVSMLGMATKVARITGLKTQGHLSNQLLQPLDDEVVIAGGGMLGGGIARELVEQTKDDPDTTIILCGYLAKNTLGYRLLHGLEPQYKQKIVFTRFSGHSSSETLNTYLKSVKGQKALVHIGDLSKDPISAKKIRKAKKFSKRECFIPSFGSSLEV
ncbi:MAG: MBL fold metallo-hydrolase [Candidatus Hodarchaeota archaeon]